eukprot:6213096-Pleurochrysis_carterae.AAC.4
MRCPPCSAVEAGNRRCSAQLACSRKRVSIRTRLLLLATAAAACEHARWGVCVRRRDARERRD